MRSLPSNTVISVFALIAPAFCVGNDESIQTQPKRLTTLIKSSSALPSELLKSGTTSCLVPVAKDQARCRTRAQPIGGTSLLPVMPGWWSWTGSNRRPPACKAGALPTELQPRYVNVVGLDGFEPSTPALSRRCSNQLSYKPGSGVRLWRAGWLAATDRLWAPQSGLGRRRIHHR